MKPIFIINSLSETVAAKGSNLKPLSDRAYHVFDKDIFDHLDEIVTAGQKSGWVIIEGGDGTAQGIITAFFNMTKPQAPMPRFTLLPGGMTNQVAKNIGLKPFTARSVRDLLSKSHKQTQMPLLRVSCAGYPNLYGFLFSTGGVPMVTDYTKDNLHKRGIGGSAAVVGGIIKGVSGKNDSILRSTNISVQVNDIKLSGSHLGTLVTTLPSLLLKLDPFWGAEDGPLRMTYVEGGANRLAAHVLALWLGRKKTDRRADGLHSYRTDKLTYEYEGPTVLDGEPLTLGTQFELSATQSLTFVS